MTTDELVNEIMNDTDRERRKRRLRVLKTVSEAQNREGLSVLGQCATAAGGEFLAALTEALDGPGDEPETAE